MPRKEPRISWQVEEYAHRPKNADWYWALGVIAVLGAAIAIVTKNPLLAILIILTAVIFAFFANRDPEIISIGISQEGIIVRGFLYTFDKIKSFSIDEHQMGQYLLIETDRFLLPVVSLPVPGTIDLDALKELLLTRLPEKKLEEPLSHKLMEYLGL